MSRRALLLTSRLSTVEQQRTYFTHTRQRRRVNYSNMLRTEKPLSVALLPQSVAKPSSPPIITTKRYYATQNHPEVLSIDQQYEECISDLNGLQSNAITIRRSILNNNKQMPLTDTYKYIERSGLNLADLERIPFIHVSGTKGKGSTCALTDSILSAHGIKTGFFSSPHLVSVTERIRINGQPISKQKFVRTFRRVYTRLRSQQQNEDDMPAYFKFLTILSFHIFLEERVQVVILEVGIGGELDCTNVISNTQTVGISSLGLEHTHLLGDTLREIAWQKAGIIKERSDVYTSVTQPECLEVIKARAKERNATLHIVPEYEEYFSKPEITALLSHLNDVIKLNGSLAIQLAYDWLRKHGYTRYKHIAAIKLTSEALKGLQHCKWPGRCEIINIGNFIFHIDGAHTVESMRVCSDWFKRVTAKSPHPRILIFNTTGERDTRRLLEIIHQAHNEFALHCFVPNFSTGGNSNHHDNITVYGINEQMKRARHNASIWQQLSRQSATKEASDDTTTKTFGSILDCLLHLRAVYGSEEPLNILVTGSIHLIGATMAAFPKFQELK